MQTTDSVAFTLFVVFYAMYLAATVIATLVAISLSRERSRHSTRKRATLREFKRIVATPDRLIIVVMSTITIYVMTKWIFQQITQGCMTIAWWNPTCYDMSEFNRSWFAVFVVVAVNAVVITLKLDTKRQDLKFTRETHLAE